MNALSGSKHAQTDPQKNENLLGMRIALRVGGLLPLHVLSQLINSSRAE